MKEKELWQYFLDKKIASSRRPFNRQFVWIDARDFAPVKHHFRREFNIVQLGESFRSRGYLFHIHAVDQGEVVFVHRDTGNVAKFPPLGLVHFFLDLAPDLIVARRHGVPVRSLYVPPQHSDATHS